MRAVFVMISGLLAAAALSGCADDDANGDGIPSTGPTATAPAAEVWPPLPPGEEFDPEGYLPEGDSAPRAEPSAGSSGSEHERADPAAPVLTPAPSGP